MSFEIGSSKPNGTVYRTKDSMKNWSEASSDLQNSLVTAVATNPINDEILYAGTAQNGIYKSVDGGKSWRQSLPQIFNFKVNDIKINPENTDECVAACDWGLLYTSDAGANWSQFTGALENVEIRQVEFLQTEHGTSLYAVTAHAGVWVTQATNSNAAVVNWPLFQ